MSIDLLPPEIIDKINRMAFDMEEIDKVKENYKRCLMFFKSMSITQQAFEKDNIYHSSFIEFCEHMCVFDHDGIY